MNRHAAEMTIGTIVIIILAIVVLVVLVYGFTVGWGDLFNQLTGLGGGNVNVQTVVQGCQIACSTQASFDFCQLKKSIVFTEDKNDLRYKDNNLKFTCAELVFKNVGLAHCDQIVCDVVPAPVAPNPPVTP